MCKDLQDQGGVGEGSSSSIRVASSIGQGSSVSGGNWRGSVGSCYRSGVGGQGRRSHKRSTVGTVGSYWEQWLGGDASDGQDGEEDLKYDGEINSIRIVYPKLNPKNLPLWRTC